MKNIEIASTTKIKILGIDFDQNLNWKTHVDKIVLKAQRILHGLRYLRRYFNESEFNQITTSTLFTSICYGAEVWLTESLDYRSKQKLDLIFYKSQRILKNDFNNIIHREQLFDQRKRATPTEFMKYINARTLFQITTCKTPTYLYKCIMSNTYCKRRVKNRLFIFNNYGSKVGKKLPFK